jgi:hypothetical protein
VEGSEQALCKVPDQKACHACHVPRLAQNQLRTTGLTAKPVTYYLRLCAFYHHSFVVIFQKAMNTLLLIGAASSVLVVMRLYLAYRRACNEIGSVFAVYAYERQRLSYYNIEIFQALATS